MPYKNRCKTHKPDITFHIYGRGINRCEMFLDHEDYIFFIYLLKKYLTKDFKESRIIAKKEVEIPANSVFGQLELYAYCLMPNHFHILCKNLVDYGIKEFSKRILSVYAGFFNEKYSREGPLIQGCYRAVPIITEAQLIHVGRYIHLNPYKSGIVGGSSEYKYSSLQNYINNRDLPWLNLHPTLVQSTNWSKIDSYAKEIEYNPKQGIFI
ncbi:transposase [Candidatus Parcubacteria bacterium]|nr:transposase [Patescibacteria group bacterium]MCG2689619.1 transposase [Candidatus Parcubacteria bacterium]